jgi:hypothetical protein
MDKNHKENISINNPNSPNEIIFDLSGSFPIKAIL